MNDRELISGALAKIEQEMKELEIRFEQYFAGVEKRAPIQEREKLATLLRRFVNRRIIQTDLRFKSQNLATRFHSYCGYWDRILRLMDEGRYVRQAPRGVGTGAGKQEKQALTGTTATGIDAVYRDLLEARKACGIEGAIPSRQQIVAFLERQKTTLREKFGDREVEFRVVTEDGKPKIRARARK
jgi:hypothetical protein